MSEYIPDVSSRLKNRRSYGLLYSTITDRTWVSSGDTVVVRLRDGGLGGEDHAFWECVVVQEDKHKVVSLCDRRGVAFDGSQRGDICLTGESIQAGDSIQRAPAPENAVLTGGYTYPDGTTYVGGWNEKGQKHGFGHLSLPDSSRYVGCFRDGLCSGIGVMIFPDGARYEGEFMEGWFHGHGMFARGDGMKYEGEFRGGRLWGWGLVTFRDSTHGFPRQEGFFQDCRLIRNRKCDEVIERAQKVALIARALAEDHYSRPSSVQEGSTMTFSLR